MTPVCQFVAVVAASAALTWLILDTPARHYRHPGGHR